VLVEVAIRDKFIDKKELDVLSLQAPRHKIAYAAAPSFEPYYIHMAGSADRAQLREEVLKFSPRVFQDFLHSHMLLLKTTTIYHAEATRSDLLCVGESICCDR
jgi:hypothetical protein